MAAAVTGLAALLHTSALAFQTLKYAGVAYLLYLAWTTIRDKSVLTVEEETAHPSAARVITSGVLINILNPKLTIFFFAFVVKLGRVSRRVAPACPRPFGFPRRRR